MSDPNGRSRETNLEGALVESIATPNLTDLTADLAEVGLDQLIEQGVLRDIPILGTLVGAYRTVGIVRDLLFAKKVIRFLTQLGATSTDERKQFVEAIEDARQRQRIGETLLLLLDRLDEIDKPTLLGKFFSAYVRGQVDLERFLDLSAALDRVPLSSLPELSRFYVSTDSRSGLRGRHLGQFVSAGLIDIEFVRTGPTGGPGGQYSRNQLGAQFLEFVNAA
jgi:hypothetical protein